MSGTGASTYVHCGVGFRSEIELPLRRSDDDPQVEVIRGSTVDTTSRPPLGTLIAESGPGDGGMYAAWATDAGFLIRYPGHGEFAISAGLDVIEVCPDLAAGDGALLPLLLVGGVAAMFHELRGATILHASAVAVDGKAIAFVGGSGRGKSTIAARMCAAGAALVTDDLLAVDASPTPTCIGAAYELRLRQEPDALGVWHHDFDQRRTDDGRVALAPHQVVSGSLPLAAIVVPKPDPDAPEVRVFDVPPVSRLVTLLAFPRIDAWSLERVLAQRFDTLAAVAASTPMYVAEIPWRAPLDDSVPAGLWGLVGS